MKKDTTPGSLSEQVVYQSRLAECCVHCRSVIDSTRCAKTYKHVRGQTMSK